MAKRIPTNRVLTNDEFKARWAGASFADRRRVTRVVSLGRVAENRTDAQLAIPTARRQMTFWRWAWLGGLLPVLTLQGQERNILLVNLAFGLLLMGGLAVWKFTRARRALNLNVDYVTGVTKDGSAAREPSRAERAAPPAKPSLLERVGLRPKATPTSGRSEAELLGLDDHVPHRGSKGKGTPKEKPKVADVQPNLGKPFEGKPSPATSAKKRRKRK